MYITYFFSIFIWMHSDSNRLDVLFFIIFLFFAYLRVSSWHEMAWFHCPSCFIYDFSRFECVLCSKYFLSWQNVVDHLPLTWQENPSYSFVSNSFFYVFLANCFRAKIKVIKTWFSTWKEKSTLTTWTVDLICHISIFDIYCIYFAHVIVIISNIKLCLIYNILCYKVSLLYIMLQSF